MGTSPPNNLQAPGHASQHCKVFTARAKDCKGKMVRRVRSPRNRRRAAVFTEAMEPAETQRQVRSLPLGESAIDWQCRIRKAGRKEIP
jgi:hypothetical protein